MGNYMQVWHVWKFFTWSFVNVVGKNIGEGANFKITNGKSVEKRTFEENMQNKT